MITHLIEKHLTKTRTSLKY